MPSRVKDLLQSAGLAHTEVVSWGTRLEYDRPGVYIVALAQDLEAMLTLEHAPLDRRSIEELLQARPELTVDRERPDVKRLGDRLARMWPAGETVLYIGRASASVSRRVADYYTTPLGARTPHAGGWPIKTLAELGKLHVHAAAAAEPAAAEEAMIDQFVSAVSQADRQRLIDPTLPLPFANLEDARRRRKHHGIQGARAPYATARRRQAPSHAVIDARPVGDVRESPPGQLTVNVTAGDLAKGQIRITRPAKRLIELPDTVADLPVRVHGEPVSCSWDARLGPDKERSGLLRIGKARLAGLLPQGATVLTMHVGADGGIQLD